MTTTYARPNPRTKWHIVTVTGWTLCYHNAQGWERTTQPGEVCKACQAVHEARVKGVGIPF